MRLTHIGLAARRVGADTGAAAHPMLQAKTSRNIKMPTWQGLPCARTRPASWEPVVVDQAVVDGGLWSAVGCGRPRAVVSDMDRGRTEGMCPARILWVAPREVLLVGQLTQSESGEGKTDFYTNLGLFVLEEAALHSAKKYCRNGNDPKIHYSGLKGKTPLFHGPRRKVELTWLNAELSPGLIPRLPLIGRYRRQ